MNYVSSAIEDDKFFEIVVTTLFKIQVENQSDKQYAGKGVGRRDYDPKAAYLQDLHRSHAKGGSVSNYAPFGTSADSTTETRN